MSPSIHCINGNVFRIYSTVERNFIEIEIIFAVIQELLS
ncbi:hypothetical protein ECHJAX_0792 [Ehrlichia chaffeensis str. Jax]|nr:hypothetical protein ECHJAX_0792 [Ehrlichia chaffeensis str. Jax]